VRGSEKLSNEKEDRKQKKNEKGKHITVKKEGLL